MSGYWVSGLSYLQRDIGNGRNPLWRLLGNPAWRCGLWEVMGTGSGCRTVPGPCPPQKLAHASNGRDEKTMRTLLCKTRCCPQCVRVFWRRQWCFFVRLSGFFNQFVLFQSILTWIIQSLRNLLTITSEGFSECVRKTTHEYVFRPVYAQRQ